MEHKDNTDFILEKIKKMIVEEIPKVMKKDCRQIVLYGSYARGDYSEDSDVDVAIITACDREHAKEYNDSIDSVAADIGIDTLAVVNFVCLPYVEYEGKKTWYPYFKNIAREGVLLYEC